MRSLGESAPPTWLATLPVVDVRERESGEGLYIFTDAA